jgi:hypothetical protein
LALPFGFAGASERALTTLPPTPSGPAVGLRRQIEADLAMFKGS